MCDVLQIARNTFYYAAKEQTYEDDVIEAIVEIFHNNLKDYGTQKIRVKPQEHGFVISTRRIDWIMNDFPPTLWVNISPVKPLLMKQRQGMVRIVSSSRSKINASLSAF